jgi:uncharacterized protein with von Willebrand factor type A (vWA) domain
VATVADAALDGVGAELVSELTDFTFALRLAGLEVTIDATMNFLRAVALLDSLDQVQMFWAGRATLCCEPADFDIYDETFNWFFRRQVPAHVRRPAGVRPMVRLVALDTARPSAEPATALESSPSSEATMLRHKELAELTEAERAELAGLLQLLGPTPPMRRSARRTPTRRGHLDHGRAISAVLRGGGQIRKLHRRAAGTRPRKMVLLIDVSQSMAPYADSLLRFAHGVKRKLGNGCEVFTLGTGLTRLTTALGERETQRALSAVASTIPDSSAGTQLGQALRAFLDQHGQRGMARGAVVIIFSDGRERGSAELLAAQTRRLSRLTRSLIWVNPQQGKDSAAPAQSGIVAVEPFCDHLLAGHSLTTLGELMDIAHDA